jgi:hypothetical protein
VRSVLFATSTPGASWCSRNSFCHIATSCNELGRVTS